MSAAARHSLAVAALVAAGAGYSLAGTGGAAEPPVRVSAERCRSEGSAVAGRTERRASYRAGYRAGYRRAFPDGDER